MRRDRDRARVAAHLPWPFVRPLLALLGAGVLLLVVLRIVQRPPGVGPTCRIALRLAVPRLEAAPIVLAGPVETARARACRLTLRTGAATDGAPLALLPGDAWAGPTPSRRLPFALVADRVGALLLAHDATAPHFLWHGLAGRVVVLGHAAGDLGPTVVRAMLAYHEVHDSRLLTGLGPAAFAAGTGDVLEVPLWRGEALLRSGRAELATDLALAGGPLPAAVLAASPAFARAHPTLLAAITVALARATEVVRAEPNRAARLWPHLGTKGARATLAAALRRAHYEHLWPDDPRIDASLFVRLDVLRRAAGLAPFAPPPVLTAPAEYAIRRLPPADVIPDGGDRRAGRRSGPTLRFVPHT